MGLKILGIDMSDQSTDEIRNIIDKLGLNNLSEKSRKKLEKFPEDMRREWLTNPDSVGEFTDDIVDTLKANKQKATVYKTAYIYTNKAADIIHDISTKALEKAQNETNNALTMQSKCYDYTYDMLRSQMPELSSKLVDMVAMQTVTGTYDKKREEFNTMHVEADDGKSMMSEAKASASVSNMHKTSASLSNIHKPMNISNDERVIHDLLPAYRTNSPKVKNSGKFLVKQSDKYARHDIGEYLQKKCDDINDEIGEQFGIPDSEEQHIFITPSQLNRERGCFLVAYQLDTPDIKDVPNAIFKSIKNECRNAGIDATGFTMTEVTPLLQTELKAAQKNYTTDAMQEIQEIINESAATNIDHVQNVLDQGYMDGYNADGFDDTGHSADGDYNPMYDTAYTDAGPDF